MLKKEVESLKKTNEILINALEEKAQKERVQFVL